MTQLNKIYNYIMTPSAICITDGTGIHNVTKDHKSFQVFQELVLNEQYQTAIDLLSPAKAITQWSKGALTIDGGVVSYNGSTLTGKLVDRIITMMVEGDKTFEKFAKFLVKLLDNPSFKTRQRLMDFVACDSVQLSHEGNVIAFKNVRDDYYDKHSGMFYNGVGKVVKMNRHEVDDDHDHTCSAGLHVCSVNYLKGFWGTSGRTLKVVVDPKDFVAIPHDYNDSKARVCEYLVVEDVTGNLSDYL